MLRYQVMAHTEISQEPHKRKYLPQRKTNRLPYKILYRTGNWYFVTICIYARKNVLSAVGANPHSPDVTLSNHGNIIKSEWNNLYDQFANIYLDEYVIMPNHFHGIICFEGTPYSLHSNKESDLSNIIKRFKQETVRRIKGECGFAPTDEWPQFWQKSFYDHIIRDEKDLDRIREYIINNPLNWKLDEYHTL